MQVADIIVGPLRCAVRLSDVNGSSNIINSVVNGVRRRRQGEIEGQASVTPEDDREIQRHLSHSFRVPGTQRG